MDDFELIDKSFAVEAGLFRDVMGEKGDLLMQEQCLAVLPTADKAVTLPEAHQLIIQLKETLLYGFISESGQTKVDALAKQIYRMMHGQAPSN
eukprot:5337925-Karenia_brevis.AAC.1